MVALNKLQWILVAVFTVFNMKYVTLDMPEFRTRERVVPTDGFKDSELFPPKAPQCFVKDAPFL